MSTAIQQLKASIDHFAPRNQVEAKLIEALRIMARALEESRAENATMARSIAGQIEAGVEQQR